MRLILVRHGQTSSNVGMLLDTAFPGAELTPEGRGQATALVGKLEEQPLDGVWVSDLVRTQQTAAPLAAVRGLVPVVRPGLREISAGELEMTGEPSGWDAYLAVIHRWADGDPEARVPGGESGTEVLARFDAVVDEIAATHATPGDHAAVAVVSHGAVIRAWTGSRARNVDRQFVAETRLGNTAIVVLDGSPRDGWIVTTWADTAPPRT